MWERAVRELHQTVADGGLQGVLQAGEAALVVASVDVEFLRFGGADDADALAEHPGGAVPDAGIAVALGRLDRRCYGDEIPAAERWHGGIGGRVEREAQAACDWLQGIAGLRGGADAQIDGLHLLGDLLVGERAEGDDAADGAGALDGAGERDGLVLGEMAKLGLRRGAGLHLCGEAAEKQPGSGERPQGDARLPTGGCCGQQAFEQCRDAEPCGREPITAGDEDAGSEGQSREEERRAGEAYRIVLDGADVALGGETSGGVARCRSLRW